MKRHNCSPALLQQSWIPFILLLLFSVPLRAQFTFNINSVVQVSYDHPFQRTLSNDLEINFRYTNPPGNPVKYLNVYARTASGPSQIWAAENIVLDTFTAPRTLVYTINLAGLGIFDGIGVSQISLVTLTTDTVLKFPMTFPPTSFVPFVCGTGTWRRGNGLRFAELDTPASPVHGRPPNDWTHNDTLRRVTRGCRMPNIDLDSGANNPTTVPGYAGDWNACVPAACANSLQWLQERHPGKLDTSLSLRKKLEELSKLMKRRNKEGVFTDTMIAGKLAYIDKYKLPIHVKFQSVYYTDSCIKSFDSTYGHCAENQSKNRKVDSFHLSFDWLFEEMKKGEDVEMHVGWWTYDSTTMTGRWTGGHTVVVTGVEEVNGVRRIIIKEDSNQAVAGGTREVPLTHGPTGESRYSEQLKEWGSSDPIRHTSTVCLIKDLISESYDSTVTFPAASVPKYAYQKVGLHLNGNPLREGELTGIEFYIASGSRLRLSIVDMNGRLVAVLANKIYGPGVSKVYWNGNAKDNHRVSQGMYFVVLTTEWGSAAAKLIVE